ncbi:MAG: sigma-B regulation protein RsbU (phosphoserine phosphatase) [Porticoccaceae bacterium]|jgi:sigma-B regulation protein RsbU (phosphoserine phosphatase)
MTAINSLVILVGEDENRLKSLQKTVQSCDRPCALVSDMREMVVACEDPISQLVVLVSSDGSDNLLDPDNDLKALLSEYLVAVCLEAPSAEVVATYFRHGASDVWFDGMSQQTISESLSRIQEIAVTRIQRHEHSGDLEKTNVELQESLRLLKQDQIAGLEVQKSLMPESPLTFGDYEISHSVTPSLYLSGDFIGYNFVLGRYLLFYFADVSGHGASSAFVTVLLRFMIGRVIRRHITENDHEALTAAPEGLLEHINNQILASGLGKHLTVVAGCLDTETSTLRYVVGAQLPRPIMIVDGKADYLPGMGKPVGIFEDAVWEVEEIQLPERCALVLLSDGVFELVPDKELIDKEKTLLQFLGNKSNTIENLKEALSVDFVEAPQDDVSMLLLTRGM